MMRGLASSGAHLIQRTARKVSCLWSRRAEGTPTLSHDASVVQAVTRHNMLTQPDEAYYAQQYLRWMLPELNKRFANRRLQIFDLGCGQGRLSVPLAEWCAVDGGQVTGVDLTPSAVEYARQYATTRSLRNASFQQADVLSFVQQLADASADVILLVEVTFFLPSSREVVQEIGRVLRAGGVAFIAFRSQYYNLLQTVQARLWESADMVLIQREGRIFAGPIYFTWQTPQDIERLLAEAGLTALTMRGVGICSGIKGDALAAVAQPSQLSAAEQERLMEIEQSIAETYAANGRYILVTAMKDGA